MHLFSYSFSTTVSFTHFLQPCSFLNQNLLTYSWLSLGALTFPIPLSLVPTDPPNLSSNDALPKRLSLKPFLLFFQSAYYLPIILHHITLPFSSAIHYKISTGIYHRCIVLYLHEYLLYWEITLLGMRSCTLGSLNE